MSIAAAERSAPPRRALAPPRLAGVATALPEQRVDQANARAFAAALFSTVLTHDNARLLEVFDRSGVDERHVCMPLEWYGAPHTLAETNALYLEHATRLLREAATAALEQAGLEPRDVDHVVCVSSTGIATPSLDARLANLMGFRSDVRRSPLWGLGCAGGAGGLGRAREFALADPGARVLLLAVELCSLTFQHGDRDRRNLVATSLFSDGAAAAVVCGREARTPATRPGVALELLASGSTLWPESLDVMGWTVDGDGLHVVFSRDIPTIVRDWVRPSLDEFLRRQGLSLEEIRHVVAHPGGPKVLAAYAQALGLPPAAFRHSRDVLRTCGNMSSPTCLFVLERTLAAGDFAAGDLGVLSALGPGFAAEYVLLRAV